MEEKGTLRELAEKVLNKYDYSLKHLEEEVYPGRFRHPQRSLKREKNKKPKMKNKKLY